MHRHGIKETAGHFYEEWHQKLHNNTTPDDIPICEALLIYLRSGNLGDYWNHLTKNGITKERLASYERKIVHEPWMKKEAIGDFENYLRILKQMHSSDDLNMLIDEAKRHVGGDTHHLMQEVRNGF
jgi:alpha-glucan,water dikinase